MASLLSEETYIGGLSWVAAIQVNLCTRPPEPSKVFFFFGRAACMILVP